ncbi:MAG: hypothetical protein QGD94_10960, partial [Planctomycetia bacterium]|nr:hypothetical protein [Planctomycetia bacterium]
MKGFIQVADDGWNFIDSATGEYYVPHGAAYFNCHTGKWPPFVLRAPEIQMETLPSRFKDLWEKMDFELGLMEELGCNFVYGGFACGYLWPTGTAMDAKAEDEIERYLDLIGKHGMRISMGVSHIPVYQSGHYSKQTRERILFHQESFYRRFGNRPEIFCDSTMGEGTIPSDDPHVNAHWGRWAEEKYGRAELAEKAWKGEVKKVDFTNLPAPAGKVGPDSTYLYDYKLFQEDFGTQMLRERSNAAKRGAAIHGRNILVYTNINPWIFPNVPMHQMSAGECPYFHNDFVDFQSIHLYPPPFCLPGGFGDPLDSPEKMQYAVDIFQALTRMAYHGKPVIWGEWGWYGGSDSRWGKHKLPYRSEAEQADYCERMIRSGMDWASGWSNWAWCDYPGAGDITNAGGLYTADYKLKEWGKRYKKIISELEA